MKVLRSTTFTLVFLSVLLSGLDAANILSVVPCRGGHFSAMMGITKQLLKYHNVTFYMDSPCKFKVEQQIPETWGAVMIEKNHRPAFNKIEQGEFFLFSFTGNILKGQDKIYSGFDQFLQDHKGEFDLALLDWVNVINIQVAEKNDLPIVISLSGGSGPVKNFLTQYVGDISSLEVFALAMFSKIAFWGLGNHLIAKREEFGLPPLNYSLTFPYDYASQLFPLIIQGGPPFFDPLPSHVHHVYVGSPRHLSTFPPVTPELRAWIDQLEKPVLYISLGENLFLSNETMRGFIDLFQKSEEYRVIWAVPPPLREAVAMVTEVSPQLYFGSVLPQVNLLAEPKVKVAAIHGGQLSVYDCAVLGVPFICMPGFGDQAWNCGRAQRLGLSRTIRSFDPDMLHKAVLSLLNNLDKFEPNFKKVNAEFGKFSYENATLLVNKVLKERIRSNGLDYEIAPAWFLFVFYGTIVLVLVTPFVTLYALYQCCMGTLFGLPVPSTKLKSQ